MIDYMGWTYGSYACREEGVEAYTVVTGGPEREVTCMNARDLEEVSCKESNWKDLGQTDEIVSFRQ